MIVQTIETDPISPFGEPEVPHAEWTYRAWREHAMNQGLGFIRAYLMQASVAGRCNIYEMPEFPTRKGKRKVYARVDCGRWLWWCPICNGASVCSATDHRAFCIDCFNAGDGWWPVAWPNDTELMQIDTILGNRLNPSERNFDPGTETIRDLQNENLMHGVNPDAPGIEMVGNPEIMVGLREKVAELGYPIVNDKRLIMPMSPVLRELWGTAPVTLEEAEERLAKQRELEAGSD